MSQFKFTLEDKLAAAAVSLMAAVFVGLAFALTAAGLFWWNELPVPRPATWFVVATAAASTATFFYVLWLFISGQLLPSELWASVGRFFREGNDVAP